MESNPVSYATTMLEYYLGIRVDDLTDAEWAEKWQQLQDIRKKEAKEQ